jgi:hypothetical protein
LFVKFWSSDDESVKVQQGNTCQCQRVFIWAASKHLNSFKNKSVIPAVCMRTEMYQINKLSLSSEAVQFWYTTIKVHQQRYHGTVLTIKVHSDNQVTAVTVG